MEKSNTVFEQVPLDVVKKLIVRDFSYKSAMRLASCVICHRPVELEICKTDEHGDSVHEKCYAAKMRRA